ncbi:glycosyltransferase involved in cell wall biosynthesis [Povalibacter uvarum]|uniref:Glycosyltransferase involved in cell wall biosynthesis n=1 Tax=Povalibacter uvarum TaxID=732238 RepID=A0A841HGB2_9GAMM|nr:glycosyltransferase [Povalibacter uvarum]MBB6091604.1 glycosyltransferase involved in cell wall biosynthesis [Povalibacter uvarum]
MTDINRKRLFLLSDANTAHTERWAVALAQRGYEILLFSLTVPLTPALLSIPGVRFETAGIGVDLAYSNEGSARKLLYLRALPMIRRLAREFRPSVCHAHYASSYGVLAMLARLPRLVVSVWGADVYNTPHRSMLHRMIVTAAIRSADIVLSTSNVMRQETLRLCRREIGVVPFGIDTRRFQPRDRPQSRELTVGTVKSLEDKYGIDVLLRAFASACERVPDPRLRLLIVGGGSRREALEKLSRDLGIEGRTVFAGRVDYARTPEMHSALDIAVFPSVEDSESFGVSVIEAQACATPVIVSNVGGLPEVVLEGESAIVVPPRDVEALSNAIGKLATAPALRSAMGEAGRRHVVDNYELERCVDLLDRFYAQLQQR